MLDVTFFSNAETLLLGRNMTWINLKKKRKKINKAAFMSSCRHDCSSRQTDSNTLHIPPSRGKRLISNGVARQLVSACGECEVGSTCAQLVWQAFPGSYGWESGNRLASGWSPSPPNSPLSPFPGLWHQLPAKQKDKELRQKKCKK